MNTIQKLLLASAFALLSGIAAGDDHRSRDKHDAGSDKASLTRGGCSLRDVRGRWLFATSIGRQMAPVFPPDKDLTALGTLDIRRDGTLSGSFALTVEDYDFFPVIGYDGSIVINRDCTGTLTFVTELGAVRTDSIAVVGNSEIIGMSQDPANLWTYQVRRVGKYNHKTR